MRPSVAQPSQECAATQKESQGSQDGDAVHQFRHEKGWGRLWALAQNLAHIDLTIDELRLGRRPTCNVVYDARVIPNSVLTFISGDHCRIIHAKDTSESSFAPTFIEDLSSNGTFVNYKRIGKGEQKLLRHGDRIDLVRPARCLDKAPVAYMFEDFATSQKDIKQHEKAFADKYNLGKELGAGNFSRVYLAFRKSDGKEVAVKCIDKRRFWGSPKTKEQLLREADILREVQHPNIISVYEVVDSVQFLYLILELASGGELFDMIRQRGSVTENEARTIFRQMFSAVAYLHQRGIAHRDLKPENVLFTSKDEGSIVKISDFGLARIVGDNLASATLCGTPQYVAPEIILLSSAQPSEATERGYGVSVDMWSLGVMLYVLLSGIFPFDENVRPGSLFQQIEQGVFDFPPEYFHNVSPAAQNLIKALLRVNPRERLSAEAALLHAWIVQPPASEPTLLPLNRAPSLPRDTPEKARPVMVDTDEESTGTRRKRRESIEAEQFSPEMAKSFKLKIPPADRKKLTFST